MLTLNDGRTELWQWDTGRTLAVDAYCSQVHFSNKVFGRSIDVDVADGVAIIPDILLQTDKDLNAWAFVGTAENGYTKISKTFKVNRRNKPSDYVFTPTEQMTLQTIQRQIGALADLTTTEKDTLVAAINEAARTGGGAGSMDLRVADGYVQYSTDGGMTWTNLIAMADIKGDPGAPGKDGHSPVVTATKSGKTTTISVDGAAIATVEDGADGAPGKDGAGMDITGATVGQIAKITAVDDTGKPTAWEAVDDRLPNAIPSAVGKVLAVEQTGEFEYGYGFADTPKMYDFINLGIDSASPGQFAKVAYVDDFGHPTAWEAVDIPSGSGETWELINEITIPDGAEETNALSINGDLNGNPFELKRALLLVYMPKYTGKSTIPTFAFSSLNGIYSGGSSPAIYTSFVSPSSEQNRSMWWRVSVANNSLPYHEELVKTRAAGTNRVVIGGNASVPLFDEYIIDGTEPAKESITEIGTTGNLIYAGCYFALYGVRK